MKKRRILTALICAVTGTTMALNTGSGIFADEKEPVEIISKRSQYEKHYDNGNGTTTAFINTAPLHYYENGQWCEIDNSLELNESGDYVNKSNSMDITLASSASPKTANTIGNDQMVKLEYDGYTISWDMLNTQQNSNHISASSTVQLVTKDSAEDVNFTLGGEKLTEKASACLDKLNSSVVYDSVFEDVDVSLDILPSSIKETIILNDKDSVPEQFAYYITADGLDAELQSDNSIEFTNEQDEVIFTMPAMFMFDSSSEIPEYNYDIETAIVPIKNGYLLTITPDSDWLNSDDRVYPVMIDPEFMPTITTLTDSYITEEDPNLCATNLMLKMGGSKTDHNRFESFLYFNPSDILTTADEILDATCTMFFVPDTEQESYPTIAVSLLQESVSNPTWNTANYSKIDSVDYEEYPTSINFAMYQDLDITGLVQTWQNYIKTNSVVGSPNYGFKLLASTPTGDYSCISAYSSRYLWPPSFKITYRTQTPYKLYYSPDKYNNKETVTNFQNRMNCYAYALQVYYRGYLATGQSYYLKPGEIGIGRPSSINYPINNINELEITYSNFETLYKQAANDEEKRTICRQYLKFIEEQMNKDSQSMGFSITALRNDYNSSNYVPNNAFLLPPEYNENSERYIALVTYYYSKWNTFLREYVTALDYHYYIRHGSGSCENLDHESTCSKWSHKIANSEVTDKCANDDDVVLCDANIGSYANSIPYSAYSLDEVRYYSITKDTNVYNSWYEN